MAPPSKSRGGRYVLWGARRRDIQIGGVVDRGHQDRHRLDGIGPFPFSVRTKRGKQIGW